MPTATATGLRCGVCGKRMKVRPGYGPMKYCVGECQRRAATLRKREERSRPGTRICAYRHCNKVLPPHPPDKKGRAQKYCCPEHKTAEAVAKRSDSPDTPEEEMPGPEGSAYGVRTPVIDRDGLGWMDFAACKGNGEVFFTPPSERREARERREAAAREICNACPVKSQCLEHAMTHREGDFWGGMSERERANAGAKVVDRSVRPTHKRSSRESVSFPSRWDE